jgi:hypothetical protein
MDIVLSGSGIISMYNLDTETLTAKLSGSGSIELQGVATTAKLSIPGSGRIKGYSVRTPSTTTGKLEMNDCEVSISGSGQAFVYVWDYLDIHISGSGSVYYRGHPKDLFVDIPGSGHVINDN